MKQKQQAEYDVRLVGLAAAWLQQAQALDVYLRYEFSGVAAAPDRDSLLEAADAFVKQVIQTSGALERQERWLNLVVDRQPEGFHLECSAAGICPLELFPLVKAGAEISLVQHPDAYDLTVDWSCRAEDGQ